MSESILQTSIELALSALAVGGGVGGALTALRAGWRAGGQWGADLDHRDAALRASIEIEKARAAAAAAQANYAAALEPRHVTYSPHYAPHSTATHQSGSAMPMATAPVESEAHELPGMIDLADIGHMPTSQSILLALGPGGAPITVPAKNLCHVGLVGATGQGKSNIGRLVLSQLLVCGVPCVVADPHWTDYDAESDEDWRPIRKRLHAAPAVKAGDIGDMLQWFCADELTRRLELRGRGERVGKPMVLYVDELPTILENIKGAMDSLTRILREGRKVGLFLVTATQDMLTKTLGSGGAIRDNFRTGVYLGGDVHSAATILDMPRKSIEEDSLGKGIVYLRCAATTPAQQVRVPLVSNDAIYHLLTDDHATMPNLTAGQRAGNDASMEEKPGDTATGRGEPLTVQEQRILTLARQATPISQIVEDVWGVKGGSKYNERSGVVMRVIAENLQQM